MQLKPNTYYHTCGGLKAYVGFKHPSRSDCWIGYIIDGNHDHVITWFDTGKANHSPNYDLAEVWTDKPVEGTGAWTKTLPQGTYIRHQNWGTGEYLLRGPNGWIPSRNCLLPPDVSEPKPCWVHCTQLPLTHNAVRPGYIIKHIEHGFTALVLEVNAGHVGTKSSSYTYEVLAASFEISRNGGKIYEPCFIIA